MKLISEEQRKLLSEFAEREFTEEEKKKFNKSHFARVFFISASITYLATILGVYVINGL